MDADAKQKDLLKLLYTDELTHLFNLRYLREQASRYIEQARARSISVAFLVLDMDNFKGINDTYGHATGDMALIHFSKTLMSTLSGRGIPIRYAGDEFVAIIPGVDKPQATQVAQKFIEKLSSTPLNVDGGTLLLRCSIGISLMPKDGITLEQLFEKADEALYVAKQRGKGTTIAYPDYGKLVTPKKLDAIFYEAPLVGRKQLGDFLMKHLTPESDSSVFPLYYGGSGCGKTALMRYAQRIAEKNLNFAIRCRGYSFWQIEPYDSMFIGIGELFERNPTLSDSLFKKLEAKYREVLEQKLSMWFARMAHSGERKEEIRPTVLFEALTQLLYHLRQMGGGAIILDDIDIIDPASLQFLDMLFSDKSGGKILFVGTMNAENECVVDEKVLTLLSAMPNLASTGKIERISLQPLEMSDIREFLEGIFIGSAPSEKLIKAIYERSGGIPFNIVETVAYLIQSGKIEYEGQKWSFSVDAEESVPLHISDIIRKRAEFLNPENAKILKLAAIMGEKIEPQKLAELTGLNPQQVLTALHDGERILMIEKTPNPEVFTFTHKLVRSVLTTLLDEEERQHYHMLAAEIEQKYSHGALERVIGRLAYHYQHSNRLGEASKLFSAFQENFKAVEISEGARKMLSKRVITASMVKESPLSDEDLAQTANLVRVLKVAVQNLRLYPLENENVKKSIQKLQEFLDYFLGQKTEALSISATPEVTIVNGQAPNVEKTDKKLAMELYQLFSEYGLQGMLFIRGLTNEELLRFLAVFKRKPEEVSAEWDKIVEEENFVHVFPDRKIFVAVGERKLVLDDSVLVAKSSSQSGSQAASATQNISPEAIIQLREILEQFRKEKEELVSAIKSGAISNYEIEKLTKLLEQSSSAMVGGVFAGSLEQQQAKQEVQIDTKATQSAQHRGPDYSQVLPDIDLVKQVEQDIEIALNDLSLSDTMIRARVAAWIVKQDIAAIAKPMFNFLVGPNDLRVRRLAAAIVAKIGSNAIKSVVAFLNPTLTATAIKNFIEVVDIWGENPDLLMKLKEIALSVSHEVLPYCLAYFRKFESSAVNNILLDLYTSAPVKVKDEILMLIAERRIVEAVPLVVSAIKMKKVWDKEENIALQQSICRTLGIIRSPEAAQPLLEVAMVPKPWTLLRAKPDNIRATAVWALRQLPQTPEIQKALETLRKDKSEFVRRAAGA